MDTVDFTPYRPGHRFSALAGAAAGLLLGVCGTTMITSAAADPAEQRTPDSAARPMSSQPRRPRRTGSFAPSTAATSPMSAAFGTGSCRGRRTRRRSGSLTTTPSAARSRGSTAGRQRPQVMAPE